MKNYRLLIAPTVERDLSDILFYMKSLGTYEPNIQNFLESIYNVFELIQTTPLIGTSLETKVDIPTNIRFFVVEKYIIFYELVDRTIKIYRIISEKQDYIASLGFM